MDDLRLEIEFFLETDQRDHDLRFHFNFLLRDIGRGFEDSAGLHLGDFGVGDTKPAAAMAEHRIELVKLGDALLDEFDLDAERLGEIHLLLLRVRQELMQRRVEKTDRRGKTA
jgi:hypothetical protein